MLSATDLLIVLASFVFSFIGTITGGLGVALRAFLIFIGLPVHVAIATPRLALFLLRPASLIPFIQHRKINWRLGIWLMVPALVGGIVGAQIVVGLSGDTLRRLIGFLVIAIALLLLVKRDIGLRVSDQPLSRLRKVSGTIAVFFSDVIDSVVGGGGLLKAYILLLIYRLTYTEAIGLRKLIGLGGALGASILFIVEGLIDWKVLLIITIAGSLGAYLGGHYGIKKGEKWVRRVLITAIVILGIQLIIR